MNNLLAKDARLRELIAETTVYVAIDPGLTTGYALYDEAGRMLDMGSFKGTPENVIEFFGRIPNIDVAIVEEYKIYPHKMHQHVGSKVETIQVIGMVKTCAANIGADVVEQQSSVKPIGYNYLGKKPPSNKKRSHMWDAHAHGTFYLVSKGIVKLTV